MRRREGTGDVILAHVAKACRVSYCLSVGLHCSLGRARFAVVRTTLARETCFDPHLKEDGRAEEEGQRDVHAASDGASWRRRGQSEGRARDADDDDMSDSTTVSLVQQLA